MILIVSEDNDQSTVDVIKWLVYTKKEFFRINPNDRVNVCQYNGEGFIIKVNNYFTINTADISAFWYRRGFIFLPHQYPNDKFDSIANFHVAIKSEIQTLRDLLHYNLQQRKSIGSIFTASLNKLVVLNQAKRFGLDTPKTLVTTKKDDLLTFKHDCGDIITKSMDSGRITLPDPAAYMSLYTEEVSDSLLESLDEFFFPSYFQEKIEKKYELRVFYLEGEFYSMAIFSQNDSQTKVDFRKYNKVKPNRNVPFKLPLTIESKLQNLLEHYRLNTASLDIVVDKCGRYVFLEINPVGQFGMVSVPCNYYLEKKIAETLA